MNAHDPGVGTLAVHLLMIGLLALVLVLVWPFRALSGWAAELLIRLSDATCDALNERLEL